MNIQNFWDHKILQWEAARYGDTPSPGHVKESNLRGRFLVGRLELTLEILRSQLKNASVLDLGCGSGILAMHLVHWGARFVHGIDISSRAIALANERSKRMGCESKVLFEARRIEDTQAFDEDIVVALGVTDWLFPQDIHTLFSRIGHKTYLVSFSENRPGLMKQFHQLYVFLSYGWRDRSYVPRYYRADEIQGFVPTNAQSPIRLVRNPRMGFGVLLTNAIP